MTNCHVSELLDAVADHIGEEPEAVDLLDRFATDLSDVQEYELADDEAFKKHWDMLFKQGQLSECYDDARRRLD